MEEACGRVEAAQVSLLLNDTSSSDAVVSPNCVLFLSLTLLYPRLLPTDTDTNTRAHTMLLAVTPFLPRAGDFTRT